MAKRIAAIGLCILWLASLAVGSPVFGADSGVVTVHFFWGDGCPVCMEEGEFLRELATRYGDALSIKEYEVWYHPENKALLFETAEAYGTKVEAIPVTFLGRRVWTGFNEGIAREMSQAIEEAVAGVSTSADTSPRRSLRLPFQKEIDLQSQPLLWTTILIGFVDGMNPCSLWVLSLLLAMILRSGSRQRILLVGTTFLTVTSILYSLFVAGVFSVFSYIGYLRWIQVLVAAIALAVGAVNVKEYFVFRHGPSLTISDKSKPRIYEGIRTIMAQRGPAATIGATAVLAAGVCLMELPCTAGFPIVWSNLLTSQRVGQLEFVALLMVYMLMYLLDELIVFGVAVVTLQSSRLQERHGRLLKLGGGSLMLAFAGTLLIKPELMNELGGALLVSSTALLLSIVAALIYRRLERRRRMQS